MNQDQTPKQQRKVDTYDHPNSIDQTLHDDALARNHDYVAKSVHQYDQDKKSQGYKSNETSAHSFHASSNYANTDQYQQPLLDQYERDVQSLSTSQDNQGKDLNPLMRQCSVTQYQGRKTHNWCKTQGNQSLQSKPCSDHAKGRNAYSARSSSAFSRHDQVSNNRRDPQFQQLHQDRYHQQHHQQYAQSSVSYHASSLAATRFYSQHGSTYNIGSAWLLPQPINTINQLSASSERAEGDANASGNTDSKDNINISLDSVDFSFFDGLFD
jgi:hypothetical protein